MPADDVHRRPLSCRACALRNRTMERILETPTAGVSRGGSEIFLMGAILSKKDLDIPVTGRSRVKTGWKGADANGAMGVPSGRLVGA